MEARKHLHCSEHPGLEDLMKKQIHPLNKGVLIFSRSWAVDIGLPKKRDVVCDALLAAENAHPVLYTVVKDASSAEYENSREIAFALKQKLVNVGGYDSKVCVIPQILHLNGTKNQMEIAGYDVPQQENQENPRGFSACLYPKNYILSSRDIPMFLRALVIVVLSFRSYLSDLLGCEIFNLLTLRQYEVLSNNLLKTKKQYVFGLPGSGKTIVALKIIERIRNIFHCSAEEILYVCENQPLKKFVENQNCRSVTRVAFEKEVFPEVKHIVMDEAQNFRYNGSWYKLACNIVKSRNGIFWVFMDFFQSTHLQDSGLNFSQLYPQEWLTEVVRNAQPIYNVMFDLMRKILQAPENVNRMPYHVMTALFREAKCAHSVSGDFIEKREMETSEMVEYVTTQCISYIRQGYPLGDIAILCSTQSAAQQFRDILQLDLKRKLMKCRVRLIFKSAEEVLANVLVLDSVRRFSGLERRIVFCIHPVPAEKKLSLHLQLCAVSRAHTKLHLLFHKDNEFLSSKSLAFRDTEQNSCFVQ